MNNTPEFRTPPGWQNAKETEIIRYGCQCHTCYDDRIAKMKRFKGWPDVPATPEQFMALQKPFIVCEYCGNKRCPHASDHRNACTRSNDTDQPGSVYGASFTCPACGMVSYNVNDIREGYCGRCHEFIGSGQHKQPEDQPTPAQEHAMGFLAAVGFIWFGFCQFFGDMLNRLREAWINLRHAAHWMGAVFTVLTVCVSTFYSMLLAVAYESFLLAVIVVVIFSVISAFFPKQKTK